MKIKIITNDIMTLLLIDYFLTQLFFFFIYLFCIFKSIICVVNLDWIYSLAWVKLLSLPNRLNLYSHCGFELFIFFLLLTLSDLTFASLKWNSLYIWFFLASIPSFVYFYFDYSCGRRKSVCLEGGHWYDFSFISIRQFYI